MRLVVFVLSLFISASLLAQEGGVADKIRAAMESDVRSNAEVLRDGNRMPAETLGFFGLEDNMRVLELLPGGGWYTKLLAPVLRENGELYVAIGTNNVRDRLITQAGFDHVKVVDVEGQVQGYSITGPLDFGTKNLDLVLTFRNMHNYTNEERLNINAAVFAALKSDGHYGIIDHSRRHMEPSTDENSRRADVVQIIKEAQESGFVLKNYSDLHYRPDDELRYEVGRATVTGNTDRFTLLFRKP
jgi:predicted methyltransferase